jgi:hypothetical protein
MIYSEVVLFYLHKLLFRLVPLQISDAYFTSTFRSGQQIFASRYRRKLFFSMHPLTFSLRLRILLQAADGERRGGIRAVREESLPKSE